MNLYVGITDADWFRFLRSRNADEMNFWRPSNTNDFRAISPGELFLFKTKRKAGGKIVGGAFLVRHTTLALDLAWEVFKEANGTESLTTLRAKIQSIRGDHTANPTIGCTVLTQPFYLNDDEALDPPRDWPGSTMTGKRYDCEAGEGLRLYEEARQAMIRSTAMPVNASIVAQDPATRYGDEYLMRPRLGQGGFRVVVMDGYDRRCAATGERTLPVLEAAHIQPYSEDGPHDIRNGLFLRSDLHTLFDRGYLTITNDLKIEVSKRIREEFSNGRDYYALHGRGLKVLPGNRAHLPERAFLEWHQNNRFLVA
jgi:putative restriction endonuclease